MRPPSPWISCRTIQRIVRDPIVHGPHIEPSTYTAVCVVLPCRWPDVRRTVPPRPSCLDRLATRPGLLAVASFPLAGSITRLRPSHGVCCTYSALNLEQRPPAPTQAPVPLARTLTSQLRYAFRLSQPLDVFFRSKPFQPCFMLVALMGFGLRSLPLDGSCAVVTRQQADTSPWPARLPIYERLSQAMRSCRYTDLGIHRVRSRGRN